MKNINTGDTVVLLMDIEDSETPFFSKVGSKFTAKDISVDPYMPSGYGVTLQGYGSAIIVDKSAVVHHEDWKNIYNSVLKINLIEGMLK